MTRFARVRAQTQPAMAQVLEFLGTHPDFAEAAMGDMAEEFAARSRTRGIVAARFWYMGETVRSTLHFAWSALRYGNPLLH